MYRIAIGCVLTAATWRRYCTGWSGKIFGVTSGSAGISAEYCRVSPVSTMEDKQGKVALRWQNDWSNYGFGAHLTSDGSLRLFALITLLNLPPEMLPSVILLDEPELGLHPAGISLIGGMIRSLSTQKQIIIATQSPRLVDTFGLDQTFVLELRKGRTEVHKYAPDDYLNWLDDYATGELWEKNLLGGRP